MNWLNIEVKFLRSVDYLSCDPVERATWINLVAFCADHENGGEIKNCSDWGDRKWMQLVGVTLDEISKPCGLWWVNQDGSICVAGYPLEQEQKVIRNRNNGKKGGRPPTTKPNDTSGDKPSGLPDGSESVKRNSNSKSNRKGKKDISSLPPSAVEVADLIVKHVASLNPTAKNITTDIEKTRLSWADAVDKLNRIDGRSFDEIKQILSWAERDPFWQMNILSGQKLREKFDYLKIKMSPEATQKSPKGL